MSIKPTDPAAENFVQVCAQVIADSSRRLPADGSLGQPAPARKVRRRLARARSSSRRTTQ